MKRILQIVSSLKKNGTESFIMKTFRHYNKEGFSFDFLVFDDSKDGYYNEIIESGSEIFYVIPRRKGMISYYQELDKFFRLKANNYDAVHFHVTSLTTLAPLYFAKKYGISRRIIHMHGSGCMGFHNRILHRLNKLRISRMATDFLSCSMDAARWGYGGSSAYRKSVILKNGINIEDYKFNVSERERRRQELGIKKGILAVHVGMLRGIKNHRFLIDVIYNLKEQNEEVKLICLGTGELWDNLLDYVKERNLTDKIKFLGHRDDVGSWLSASDIMIFPSLHEGFPFALLEAQTNGLPVLASDGVSWETKLSDNFYFFGLKEGAPKWAEKVMEICHKESSRLVPEKILDYSLESTLDPIRKIYIE